MLERLIRQVKPRAVVISVFGIREGLLCTMLSEEERRKDPLLAACDDLARRRSRSIDSAYELCFWTDALFRAPGPNRDAGAADGCAMPLASCPTSAGMLIRTIAAFRA